MITSFTSHFYVNTPCSSTVFVASAGKIPRSEATGNPYFFCWNGSWVLSWAIRDGEVVSVDKDFYAWSLWERLQFVVLADQGHVGIRALGLQFAIDLCS